MFDFEENNCLSVTDLMKLGMSKEVANIFMFELLKPREDEIDNLHKEKEELKELLLKSVYPHKYGGFKKADIEFIESLTDYREIGQDLSTENKREFENTYLPLKEDFLALSEDKDEV